MLESSPASAPSTESSGKSTSSSRVPGTPKPPFDPPRRRSSLFFSKVLQHGQSPKTPGANSTQNNEGKQLGTRSPASNIGRKRMTSPRTRSVAMPGHVAQMQRLFQTAKASLRLDMRFAASPTGSIDSRMPTSSENGSSKDAESPHPLQPASGTPKKDWRYSTAPQLIAEFDVDVREPFPEGSPRLPELPPIDTDHIKTLVVEPTSSGFASPVENTPVSRHELNLSSPTVHVDSVSDEEPSISPADYVSAADLEKPMTRLRVHGDHEMDLDSAEESPILSHLKRRSADVCVDLQTSPESTEAITLSPSVKAAADSAKLKRGMLSDLFPKPPTHKGSDGGTSSSNSNKSAATPCPDPMLHNRTPMVLCPDPVIHYRCTPNHSGPHPMPTVYGHPQHRVGPHLVPYPPMPFNRTTATGSPMPMLRVKSPPLAHTDMRRPSHDASYSGPSLLQPPRHPRRQYPPSSREHVSTATEHFQPGWYYTRDSPKPSARPGTAMYSFSTAAGKWTGHSPAPDSMIRDSYRTDTLTRFAKPPSRFKKHGVAALANARGVSRYYGQPLGPRPTLRQKNSSRTRFPDDMRFRSSPPRSMTDSQATGLTHPRKRSGELEFPTIEVLEHETPKRNSVDSKLRLEEGEDVIELDEETRAAVRMSLYGAAAPDSTNDIVKSLKELSPNVMQWRKSNQPPWSRKKRRPSYWDGDLEEVVKSPAARHVLSSPIRKDDVRSQKGEVGYHGTSSDEENQMTTRDISNVVQGGTIPQEDVTMEG
ncbi:hypothetical protein LTR41_001842 [Exophiala xenobiotica]|nr:hypothetical protein LTR41_001842 [Exophiala xenobiotica]